MQATTAIFRAGGIGRWPFSKLSVYCSAFASSSSVTVIFSFFLSVAGPTRSTFREKVAILDLDC